MDHARPTGLGPGSRPAGEGSELPSALVEPPRRRSLAWLLPVLTLFAVALLALEAWRAPGLDVRVAVAEGHGLRAGAPVRYRGIEVGRVRAVRVAGDLSGVELDVRLDPEASGLAREGARFWIARPQVGLGGVRGLETLLAGPHLAVEPGPGGGRTWRRFEGLTEPPLDGRGGLEVVVEAARRGGLGPGTPVTYRQLPVGRVLSVGLASDAAAVEVRVWIEPQYAPLVRERTRFWSAGGFSFEGGVLRGFDLSLESLEALLSGELAIATPPEGGPPARTGQRFRLAEVADPRWLDWRPQIPVGPGEAIPGGAPSRALRAALTYETGRLWSTRRRVVGWVLPDAGGLVGPADLLRAPADARPGSARLEWEGGAQPLDGAEGRGSGGVERLALPPGAEPGLPWPAARRRAPGAPEDVLLWGDPAREPLALAAVRLEALESGWALGPGLALDPAEWHGALVIARADGALLGLLLTGPDRPRIAPLPE